MSENWHVEPVNDLIKHNIDSAMCWCNPKIWIAENGNKVITHNSMDGREKKEEGKKPN